MRYRDAAAFRQALEQRLKTRAAGDAARLARERKRVVFDRLLARLAVAAPDRWLLKGGFALELRLAERARATKDVDLDWQAAEEELLDALIAATAHDAGDFFQYAVERSGVPEDRLGGSHRFRVAASLAARPFETFTLDIGIRSNERVQPERLTTPDVLAFADIEPVTVPALPVELHLAEKLHAYTRTYEGARPSTRAKDLVDLALIAELSTPHAASLRGAIDATFARRDTHPVPAKLPAAPEDWRVPFRQLAEAVGVPTELAAAHGDAAALIDPILTDQVRAGTWEPGAHRWRDRS
jgi:Nucleotidyl transferase AbiEii toxin, Type IV TA system